jgi:hypothetical protein
VSSGVIRGDHVGAVKVGVLHGKLVEVRGFGEFALPFERGMQRGRQRGVISGDHCAHSPDLHDVARVRDMFGLGGRDRHHEGAALRVELHPSLGLEPQECLTHRGPRHAEIGGDLTLADQLATGQRRGEDALFHLVIGALR